MVRRRRGPRAGGELWAAEGPEWVYRRPHVVARRWRCRKRNKLTDEVKQITLTAPVTRTKTCGITDAKQELLDKVADEWKHMERATGRPESGTRRDVTVGQALDRWLETLDVAPETADDYKRDSKLYRKLLGEDRALAEVTVADVMALFTKRWKACSGRTKIKHKRALSRFFAWSVDVGMREDNPAEKVRVQKRWRDEAKAGAERGQAITVEEGKKLLLACREKFMYKLRPDRGDTETERAPPAVLFWTVLITLRTALRLSNVVGSAVKPGLLWRHVDLEEGTISIERELMKNGLPFRAPIHAELLREFRRLLRSLGRVPSPDERIVPDSRYLRKSFHGALVRAGLAAKGTEGKPGVFLGELRNLDDPRPLRLHDLRHSACTWIDDAASSTVAKILKGDSMRGSDDRYMRHKRIEDLREQLDRVPRLLTERALDSQEATV